MGSPNPDLVNADFAKLSDEQRRNYSYSLRKENKWPRFNSQETGRELSEPPIP